MERVPAAVVLIVSWCSLFAVNNCHVAGSVELAEADTVRDSLDGLSWHEVADGGRMIRAVFDDTHALVDCDVVKSKSKGVTVAFDQSKDGGEYQDGTAEQNLYQRCRQLHHGSATSASRTKRALFVYPGTKWCGKGNSARNYDDLGDNRQTDMCCRAHDQCSHTIPGLTTKYNMFNYRFHTVSHCYCDDILRACLTSVKSERVAMIVRSLFFGIAGSDCFVLKAGKVCVVWSWWGKCQKQLKTYTAVFRD